MPSATDICMCLISVKRLFYLESAEPMGKLIELFKFGPCPTITVPSTKGAKPGRNLHK